MTDVYVYDAVRSPRAKGRAGGDLAGVAPADLVAQLIAALDTRSNGALRRAADALVLGCVGQVGPQGGNVALSARILGNLPETTATLTLNAFCISGLVAIADAARRVAAGEAELALAGGVEMMSAVPFLADKAPFYSDMGEAARLGWAPVPLAADALATREEISRHDLDAATLRSHQRAAAAIASGTLARRTVAIDTPQGVAERDELVRPDLDATKLAGLEPAFAAQGQAGFDRIVMPEGGLQYRHNVANCPGMADGAALALLGSPEAGARLGLAPVARIVAHQQAGGSAVRQLEAGFAAMDSLLSRAGIELSDIEAIEFMEAFAAVPVLFERKYRPDLDRVNIFGGHLAYGHPMGASGAYLLAMLLDAMEAREACSGLVVATGGSGVGAAMLVDRF